MAGQLRIGAIGATIRRTIYDETGAIVDLSPTTTRRLVLEKPDGGLLTKAGVFSTDGTDGQIEYVTIDGDIDIQGTWRGQFYFEFGATQKLHTDLFRMSVGANLT